MSNDYYVFYSSDYSVYGHLKHASSTTVELSSKQNKVWVPNAMLAYKDTGMLVANQGFISQIDIRMFPPTLDDIGYLIPTNASSLGLVFITDNQQ